MENKMQNEKQFKQWPKETAFRPSLQSAAAAAERKQRTNGDNSVF